jgi:hypothetical protein
MTDPYLLGIMCDGACGEAGCPKCDGEGLSIGRPIEIKAMKREPFARGIKEVWLPATITHVSETEIGVAFSDGERLAVSRGAVPKHWRKPA